MTLIETTHLSPVSAEQIYEIRTLAESGQFADALIRLRKIKPLYPRNTFLVAMEKQLERLLVLPRDSEPAEVQKKTLLSSLPGLAKGAVESLRQQAPARPQPAPASPATVKPERADRDSARAQLKEQYFQHADEYLKKGAYGSALVEIRRVKIIAPDDPTVMEYERTIRQLVELQQRTGVRTQDAEQQAAPESDSPRSGAEASPTPAPPLREPQPEIKTFGADEPAPVDVPEIPAPKRSRLVPITLSVLLVVGLTIAALAMLSNPDPTTSPEDQKEPAKATAVEVQNEVKQPARQSMPVAAPAERQAVTASQSEQHTTVAAPAVPVQSQVKSTPAAAPAKQEAASEPAPAKHEPAPEIPAPQPAPVDRDPQIVRLEEPVFSSEALRVAASAEVIILVQIDPEGKPIKTLIAKSTNPVFNTAIVTAVMHSTYRPGSNADGPATKWITIPFKIK